MAPLHLRSHFPAMLLLSFFFGTNLVVSRFTLGQINPLVYVALRLGVAAILALLWSWLRRGGLPKGRHIWLHGAIVGVTATAIPMIFFVSALEYQSSGVTALVISLNPISAMLYAHFRLRDDRMTPRRIAGALVSFSGVALLLATGQTGLGEARWEGFVLVLVGVAGAGFGIVHVRKYLADESSLDIATVRIVVAAAVSVPVAWIAAGFDLSRLQWSGLLALAYGAVPGTLLGFYLYSFLVARFGPSKATQTEYVVPIISAVTGAVFLGEQLTFVILIGMVVIIAGIAIATAGGYRNRHVPVSEDLR